MAITITDIIAEWGAYYRKGSQNVKDLINQVYQGSITEGHMAPIRTEKTIVEKASAEITRVLQSFQKAFTPLGDTEFKPRKIPLFPLKIDVEEYPDDIEQSWLGFLASSNLDRKTWPFVKYWLMELVLKKSQEDFEMNEIWSGVQADPTPETPGAAGEGINGFRKLINDGITATDITPIATGALAADPVAFVTQVETFVKAIPSKYRRLIEKLFMNEDEEMKYRQGFREKYNMNYAMETNLAKIQDTRITVVALPSMETSPKLWCTVKGNATVATKKPGNQQVFKVEESKRQVAALTDFYKGAGFWIPEWVFTNDLDLV